MAAKRDRRPGIATAAWDKHIGTFTSTGRPKGTGADWATPSPKAASRNTFRGFGTPGTGEHGGARHMRDLSVQTQKSLAHRARTRATQTGGQFPRTAKALRSYDPGDATSIDEFDPDSNGALLRPTRSTDPARPRTVGAGYDSRSQTVRVRFRPDPSYPGGALYEYYDVPQNVWRQFQRAQSPGRYIDRVLDAYPYSRVDSQGNPTGEFSVNPDAVPDVTSNSGFTFGRSF